MLPSDRLEGRPQGTRLVAAYSSSPWVRRNEACDEACKVSAPRRWDGWGEPFARTNLDRLLLLPQRHLALFCWMSSTSST